MAKREGEELYSGHANFRKCITYAIIISLSGRTATRREDRPLIKPHMFIQMKLVIEEHPSLRLINRAFNGDSITFHQFPVVRSRVIKLRCTDNAELPSKHATCVILIHSTLGSQDRPLHISFYIVVFELLFLYFVKEIIAVDR